MDFTGHSLSHSLMPGHDPWLAALAILVAVLASYVAFDLGKRIRVAQGWARLPWLAGGAVAMGGGIWSMHFIAMLALHLPVGFAYDLRLTLLSLLIAALATGAGLAVATLGKPAPGGAARPGTDRPTPLPLLAGGLCLGLGIAGMHYVGMAAIVAPGHIVYDPATLALSVLVALVAATAALHLALSDIGRGRWVLAALVMGAAISGMHFTGMAAAQFVPDPAAAARAGGAGTPVPPVILAGLIAAADIIVFALALIAARLDRRISELQTHRQLAVLGQRHAATLNALPMPLALIDEHGVILTANPPWQWPGERERFVGGGSRPGEDYFGLCAVAGPAGAEVRVHLAGVVQGIRPAAPVEYAIGAGAAGRTIRLLAAPIAEGRAVGAVVAHLDITAERLAEQRMREAMRTVEAADNAKTTFLAHMSHELRTPLNAILGFSELIRDAHLGPLPERYRGYAEDIHRSGQHLLALVNDVLDLSRVESGRLELQPEPVDLGSDIQDAVSLVAQRAEAHGIAIEQHVAHDLPLLSADPLRLRQILINLLTNAVKFTPDGGRVTIDAVAVARSVRITVADTGIGMTEQEIALALEPFRQARRLSRRPREGSGLGLPLAKALVESHGGMLMIDSEPGVGTRVTVLLPAAGEAGASPGALAGDYERVGGGAVIEPPPLSIGRPVSRRR
ncbi:PAS domain-containing protein [Inquilinus limosus]|uniref:MHYT domain-containing protein n=1 Tax=Inquilinus limosus TaxID=171674 RepID=UPI003F173F2F